MGGAIATLAAISHPELVASLTLVAPGGMGEEINRPLLQRFAAATAREDLTACLWLTCPRQAPSRPTSPWRRKRARGLCPARPTCSARSSKGSRGTASRASSRAICWAGCRCPSELSGAREDPILPFAQTRNLPDNIQGPADFGRRSHAARRSAGCRGRGGRSQSGCRKVALTVAASRHCGCIGTAAMLANG